MNTTNLSGDTTQAKLRELFPVPVLMYEWPNSEELNSALRQTIREHRSAGDTVYGNGWRSDQNLETWDAPCVGQLLERVEAFHRLLGHLGFKFRTMSFPFRGHETHPSP